MLILEPWRLALSTSFSPNVPFETYETRFPSAQTAVDAVDGWVSGFPARYGVKAGESMLFDDARLHYAIEQFGSLAGRSVLELGPLEAAHTVGLVAAGATVDAVEANKKAFLRCLVTKEITKLQNANFHLGDATRWLEENPKRYDLIFACGVLYHMPDPLKLLQLIAARTDAVYLWTHYVDVDALPPGDQRRLDWNTTLETREIGDQTVRLFRRSYVKANETPLFCGGAFDEHRWMDRHDILKALTVLGLSDIRVAHDNNSNPHGPSFSVFARRP